MTHIFVLAAIICGTSLYGILLAGSLSLAVLPGRDTDIRAGGVMLFLILLGTAFLLLAGLTS